MNLACEMALVATKPRDEGPEAPQSLWLQRELIDLSPDAILVRDEEDRILFWSRGAERLYGWSGSDVMYRRMRDVLSSDGEAYQRAWRHLCAEREWQGELRQVSRGGREVTVETRWRKVQEPQSGKWRILTISVDVSARKALEAQSLRAQRLESIGTLAGGVAHDLNNILTPIIMSAPMLREDLPEDAREMIISTIETSADRGAEMVRQVLTFARGVEGERVLLCVGHLIKELVRNARDTFPGSIQVRSQVALDLWAVQGDATQLQQVLLNLCSNARDAMPEGGTLMVGAKNVELDDNYVSMVPGSKTGRHVVIEVADSGHGIPREMVERIFDPFFTTKELGKGTGLGLSTAVGIIKRHGGFTHVKSQVGAGSVFSIYLPSAARTAAVELHASDLPRGRGELVFVVDDEVSICRVTASILEKNGYRVQTAGDGTEALARFAQAHGGVRVVVTDLMMPFMDGLTLIRTLRRMDPKVLVIASTGRGDEPKMSELERLAVSATLRKPYNAEALLTTLDEVLHPGQGRAGALSGIQEQRG